MNALDLTRPTGAMPFLRRRPVRRSDVQVLPAAPNAPLNFTHPERHQDPAAPSTASPIARTPLAPSVAVVTGGRQVLERQPGAPMLTGIATLSPTEPTLTIGRIQSGLGVLAAGISNGALGCLWESVDGQRGLATAGTVTLGGRALVRMSGPSQSTVQPQRWLDHFRDRHSTGLNLARIRQMRRVLYVGISDRPRDWSGVELEMVLTDARVFAPAAAVHGVAIALASVTVIEGQLVFYREDEAFNSEQELAQAFGFPLQWSNPRSAR